MVGLVAVIAWLFWLQVVVCLAAEVVGLLRGHELAVPLDFGVQGLVRLLLNTVLAAGIGVGAVTASTAGAAEAPATEPHAAAWTTPATVAATITSPSPPADSVDDGRAAHDAHDRSVSVKPGDSLWSIAERALGDGSRWQEIATLNDGHLMSDGAAFHASAPIRPGWDLRIPTDRPSPPPTTNGRRTVREGDTLWQIAEQELGDPTRYDEIARASRNIVQPGDDRLRDADHIEPGWTLNIPGVPTSDTTPQPSPSTPPAPILTCPPLPHLRRPTRTTPGRPRLPMKSHHHH